VKRERAVWLVGGLLAMAGLLSIAGSVALAQDDGGGQESLIWRVLIAFGAGVLTSFTPCVYPMIPITIGIIGARDENTPLRRSFGLSLTYVLGLVVVYSVLGLLVGLIGPQVRTAVMSPYVLVTVAVIFGVLALGMLGLYELRLPSSVATRLNAIGGKGFVGVLLMGMVSGLVASPCTAAPLAGILTFVAVRGDPLVGFLLLFAFAWGMGLLLLVVGTSAGALTRLPRSGSWMVDVKHLFGFVFLAVAVYFVRTFIPEVVYFLTMAACLIAGGVAFGALDSLPADPGTGLRIKKGVALLITVLGLYILIGTLWSQRALLPTSVETTAEAVPEAKWGTDIDAAFAEARKEGRPVLIDWTATWCGTCKRMEKEAFPRPEVRKALAQYVPLRIDATELDAKEQKLADKYAYFTPPTLMIAEGDGKLVAKMQGYENPEELLRFLQERGGGGEEIVGDT